MSIRQVWLVTITAACLSFSAIAANFSSEQIAQFKQLPKSQQQALARQYGVNIDDLTGGETHQDKLQQTQTITPRDVNQSSSQNRESQHQTKKHPTQLVDFGYDLFAGQPSSHTPIDDLPVPNNYLIAPGDEIDIQLFGAKNESYKLDVQRNGSIQFPDLGPIHVAGQTFSELKSNLTNRIKKQVLGVDVSISLGSLRTIQVYVTGDVFKSGAYNIPSLATVTQALIAAGGFRKSGSLRDIVVRRNNKVIDRLDLYDLLLKGRADHDIRLESGDTVFVAAKKASVAVDGQVRRPAIYELKAGETLGQLLKNAGGSKADAYLQQVQIKRIAANGVHVITADAATQQGLATQIQPGDKIHLKKVTDQLKNMVMLRGAVTRQGAYAYRSGMKVDDLLTNGRDDLLTNTDQSYALLIREIDPQHHIKVLQFNLGEALSHPQGTQNLTLARKDQIFVFSSDLDTKAWQEPKGKSGARKTHDAQTKNTSKHAIDPTTGVQLVKSHQTKTNLFSSNQDNQEQAGPFSRQVLLAPVIKRLREQAVSGQSVQLYEITGSVPYPGTYPLVEGATAKDAIAAAGGLLESAAKDQAELTRAVVMPGRVSLNHQRFDLAKVMHDPKANFALQSKDRIEIQRKTNWTVDNSVEIQGEVRHPGTYTIGKGETIADLVARAGGLTQYAYPQGAVFSREVLRAQEEQRKKMLSNNLRQEIASLTLRRQTTSAQYPTSPVDAMKVVKDLNSTAAIGRLVINLPKILRGSENSDVMLENGDKLYIPPRRNTISVMGQVQMPNNFTFNDHKSVQQYIDLAGGQKKQADEDRIYVLRANGSIYLPNNTHWYIPNHQSLHPGDTIIVPIDTDYLDGLSTLSTASRILYQMGVAWKAVN